MIRTAPRAAVTHTTADLITLGVLSLLLPYLLRRLLRATPGARHVRTFVRRIPDLRPRQPRSMEIANVFIGAYLKAATVGRDPGL